MNDALVSNFALVLNFAPALEAMPLLAAIDALAIKVIVVIVMMLIYGLNNLLGKANKAKQRPVARPAGPQRADGPPRPRPQPGRQEVQDEVSEFLRRAAEKRGGGRPVETPKVEAQPAARNSGPRRLIEIGAGDLVEAQAIDEPPTGAGVAKHVQQHLDTREFSSRASNLTTVDQADEAIESHLHQVFAHQVGHLSSSGLRGDNSGGLRGDNSGGLRGADPILEGQSGAAPTTPDVTAPAEYLVSLLGNPQSLRSAVILSEVLERPTQRW